MLYNGEYTLQNKETGEHRTFKIATQDKEAKFAPGKRILSLLNGPDNESNYHGFAFVDDKCKGTNGKKSHFEYYAELFKQLMNHVVQDQQEEIEVVICFGGREYKVMLSKRCFVCNRKLTTPESIQAGIGPVCAGRIAA